MHSRPFLMRYFAMGRALFVTGGRTVKANAAASAPAAQAGAIATHGTFVIHASPAVYARLILKRAGIKPLAAALAAGAMATSASGQQAGGARANAFASARAVIISESVRVGHDVEQSRAADTANRTHTTQSADVTVTIRPCDGERPANAGATLRQCAMHITNLP